MAKKKVTKKKIKKKPPSKVSKKSTMRATAPKTKTKKKKTTSRKTTKKKVTEKVTEKVAKKPAATVLKKTTKKTAPAAKTVGKKSSKSKRTAKRPAPDANGYVVINGRRVRMMAVSVEVVATSAKRVRAKSKSEPEPPKKTRKPLKTKLTRKDLNHYRSLLLNKRAELVGDLNAMEAQALKSNGGHLSHMPIHMADVGTDTFDQDFTLGMAENERQQVREIDAALKRIEDKTYGVCQMTEKVIPKTRLNAKPWARYTIEAALRIERGLAE